MIFMFYHLRRSNSMEGKVPGIAIILPKFNIVNRFRYISNTFTKDRCSIPMDMTVVLGLHKFSLQATIDHHVPSVYSGHYTASINCRKKIYCNDSKIAEFETIDTKNSSTAYVVFGLEQKDGSFGYSHGAGTSSPSH